VLFEQGNFDGAITDFDKALEIDPRDVITYGLRGEARERKGKPDGAIADYTKAIEVDPRYVFSYNTLAWLYATTPNDSFRNGKKAVEFALKASELTKEKNPSVLDTLAAAYAEAGDFDQAINWENKALSFPKFDESHGKAARQRLKLYQERKPYREP
jgi:tetratricopeptide (TPR) repeat protein